MIHLRDIEIVGNANAVRVEKPVIIEYWRICPTVYVLMLLLFCLRYDISLRIYFECFMFLIALRELFLWPPAIILTDVFVSSISPMTELRSCL